MNTNNSCFITFENDKERIMVQCLEPKSTVQNYQKNGYSVFGTAVYYSNNLFYKMTKGFKLSTQNHRSVCIGNQEYFIQKHMENGTFINEIK